MDVDIKFKTHDDFEKFHQMVRDNETLTHHNAGVKYRQDGSWNPQDAITLRDDEIKDNAKLRKAVDRWGGIMNNH